MTGPTAARLAALAFLAAGVGACSNAERLQDIGRPPKLSAIDNPTAQPGYRPVNLPMPAPQPVAYQPNSLWRVGARAFFKDQRAQQIGDIMTVRVRITDRAQIDNQTTRERTGEEKLGVRGAIGKGIIGIMPKGTTTDALIENTTQSETKGVGGVTRSEELETNVAAVVTQILPNGNLVIEGRQEVRVNFELRELIVAGIIRPEDIAADNTIDSTKIAEARISYGGRGQITDLQQPRWGTQVLDAILPF